MSSRDWEAGQAWAEGAGRGQTHLEGEVEEDEVGALLLLEGLEIAVQSAVLVDPRE